MSVLKRLSRLEMSTHVKECVVLESYAFIVLVSRNVVSISEI